MLQKDSDRFSYKDGVGPLTPDQIFNALPESLKKNKKIVKVDGQSYVVNKINDADDIRNLRTDIITTESYIDILKSRMNKLIEKDKHINSPMTKAGNIAYDFFRAIGKPFYPELAKRNVRKNITLSEKEKEMLKDYDKREEKNMGGLLEDERIGYADGNMVEDTETEDQKQMRFLMDVYQRAVDSGQEKDAQDIVRQINELEKKMIEEKAEVADRMRKADGGSFPDLNKDGKVTYADVLKGRGVFQEGGEIDDQMSMLMDNEQEPPMESDEEMEDNYLDFILDEALNEEEEDMLMSKLEQDEQLAMLFDKVVEVASEFAGSGPVEGPGTGVSDSIPARLSDGEFVFTAKAVEEIGADELMRMMKDAEMRADERQGMANGGEMDEETVVVKGDDEPARQEIRVVKETVDSAGRMVEDEDEISKNIKSNMMLDPNQQHVRS